MVPLSRSILLAEAKNSTATAVENSTTLISETVAMVAKEAAATPAELPATYAAKEVANQSVNLVCCTVIDK